MVDPETYFGWCTGLGRGQLRGVQGSSPRKFFENCAVFCSFLPTFTLADPLKVRLAIPISCS